MPREVHTWREAGENIAKTLRAGRAGVPRDLDSLGLHLINSIKLELSQPGQGRIYYTYFFTKDGKARPVGKRMIPHRASAPYEPPAVDTGELRASYGHEVKRTSSGGELTVGSGSKHAPLTEYGTSLMAPRPHLRPVMFRERLRIRKHIANGIEGRERLMAPRLGGEG